MTSLDFMRIATKEQSPQQGGGTTLYPSFVVRPSKDLMVKGNSFFAIWDEERGVWSTDSYDVPRLVDGVLYAEAEKYDSATVSGLQSFDNGRWTKISTVCQDTRRQLEATRRTGYFRGSAYLQRRLCYEAFELFMRRRES